MAVATITITDIDLDTGQVQITCAVEGSLVDDGQMTAAEVMIRVLDHEVKSPAFRNKVWAEVAKMTKGNEAVRIANDQHGPEQEVG